MKPKLFKRDARLEKSKESVEWHKLGVHERGNEVLEFAKLSAEDCGSPVHESVSEGECFEGGQKTDRRIVKAGGGRAGVGPANGKIKELRHGDPKEMLTKCRQTRRRDIEKFELFNPHSVERKYIGNMPKNRRIVHSNRDMYGEVLGPGETMFKPGDAATDVHLLPVRWRVENDVAPTPTDASEC